MPRTYKRLCYQDRKRIEKLFEEGESFRKIARELGVHHMTISREIKRGSIIKEDHVEYSAERAQKKIFAS